MPTGPGTFSLTTDMLLRKEYNLKNATPNNFILLEINWNARIFFHHIQNFSQWTYLPSKSPNLLLKMVVLPYSQGPQNCKNYFLIRNKQALRPDEFSPETLLRTFNAAMLLNFFGLSLTHLLTFSSIIFLKWDLAGVCCVYVFCWSVSFFYFSLPSEAVLVNNLRESLAYLGRWGLGRRMSHPWGNRKFK